VWQQSHTARCPAPGEFRQGPADHCQAQWKNPAEIDQWLPTIAADTGVIVYCMRGGSVSQSVQQRLTDNGIRTRYVEGEFEALSKTDQF
jgi:hypothetical protein